jgi:hypothetical protein
MCQGIHYGEPRPLRFREVLAAIVVGAAIAAVLPEVSARSWQGRLVVEPPSRRVVLQDLRPVTLHFRLTNTGNRDVTIRGISGG